MAKKSNAADKKIKNNPLSIVLGMYLSRERNKLPDNNSSKEIAQKIGFTGISFYRMIEAGLANLHPSKVLDVLKAFPLSNINLDAFCKYLVAIQLVETRLNSYAEFNDAIYQLSVADEKLKKLFNVLKPAFKEIEKNPQEFKDAFISEKYYNEIKEYLSNYEQYAMTASDILEKKETIITNMSYELPTIYYDYVENFIVETNKLPLRINFEDLHKWEDRLQDEFRSIYAIVRNHNIVTHQENLKSYIYNYLWGKKFEKAYFIFLEDSKSPKDLKEIFIKNLKKSITKIKPERLTDFDIKMTKVIFGTCKKGSSIAQSLLTESKQNEDVNYDAFWCFTLDNDKLVGFVAKAKQHEKFPEYEIFNDGKSLNYTDTKNKLNILRNFWEKNDEQ